MSDENLSWKTHIKYIENKISKNIGILFKARPFLNKKSLLSLYYSYIHSHINNGSFFWRSTCRTNLKKMNSQQKHVLRIIFNKSKFERTGELFKSSKILCIKFKENLHTKHISFEIQKNVSFVSNAIVTSKLYETYS